jgi:hypothetical protein
LHNFKILFKNIYTADLKNAGSRLLPQYLEIVKSLSTKKQQRFSYNAAGVKNNIPFALQEPEQDPERG